MPTSSQANQHHPYQPPQSQSTANKTIQPLFLAQANVFFFDATSKSRSWTALRSFEVPISILYDENRAIYRIISMDLNGESNQRSNKVLVNSTILPFLEFHKTSGTFGHWTDKSTGKIYGIGFHSQFELEAFEDSLKKAQSAIYTLVNKSSGTSSKVVIGDGPSTSSNNNPLPKNCIYPSGANYKNWGQLLQQVKKTHAKVPNILVPEANSSGRVYSHRGQGEGSSLLLPPAPPQHLHVSNQNQNTNTISSATFTVSQSPLQHNHHPQKLIEEDLSSSWHALREENGKLREVAAESNCNARKWEVQIATVKAENETLSSKVQEARSELENLKQQENDFKSALEKWQECVSKNNGKLTGLASLEEKVKGLEGDVQGLEELLRLENNANNNGGGNGNGINRVNNNNINNNEDIARLENYYKGLIQRTKNTLEEVTGSNREGTATFQRIDYQFAKTIHDMIGIHEKINICGGNNKNHHNINAITTSINGQHQPQQGH